jgi:PAS domain S-box-containing protein
VADAGVARAAHLGTLSSGEALLLLGSWGLVCMLAVAVWSLGARLGQVREEQRLYREMVESANSIVLRLDMGGTVTYANHHALEVFGYDWHELVGRDLRETLLPPGDADTFPHAWEKLAEAPGRYAAHENDNRRKDGSVLRVAWSNRVLRSRSGQSLGVVSIGNNVTELRRQQRALSRLKPALDQAPDGVVVMDLDGVVEYANPVWARQHGFDSPEAALGAVVPLFNGLGPADPGREAMAERLRTRGSFAGELQCPVGGAKLDCWVSASLVRDENDRPVSCVAIFRDISRQKLLEAEIRESEERFSQMVNTIDEAFWLRSREHLLYLSPGYERVFGCTLSDSLHDPLDLFALVHPDDRGRVERALAGESFRERGQLDIEVRIVDQGGPGAGEGECVEAGNHGEPEAGREAKAVAADANVRWIRVRSYPILHDGELHRVAGVAEDITRYKEIEGQLLLAKERAEAATRTKSMILNNVTHEIRTPLNGVLGMLQILQISGLDETRLGYVNAAMESASDLGSIIDTILRYSEVDSGQVEPLDQPYSLFNTLQGVVETHRQAAVQRGLHLSASVAPGTDDALSGDGARLRQALEILVGNAIKFTASGEVALEAATERAPRTSSMEEDGVDGVELLVTVRDTGVGIPAERLAEVAEGFVQAEQTRSRRFGGLGLGLGMARRLVEIMGGRLEVRSEEGRGTEVTVRLAARSVERALGEPVVPAVPRRDGKRLRVLLAEGPDTEALAAKFRLQRRGVRVDSVYGSDAALEALGVLEESGAPDAPDATDETGAIDVTRATMSERYDLLLLRDKLVQGTPSDVLRSMEKGPGGKVVPPALVLGRGEEAQRCLELGAAGRLSSPVHPGRLGEVFAEVVGIPERVDTPPGKD